LKTTFVAEMPRRTECSVDSFVAELPWRNKCICRLNNCTAIKKTTAPRFTTVYLLNLYPSALCVLLGTSPEDIQNESSNYLSSSLPEALIGRVRGTARTAKLGCQEGPPEQGL
jgi:hypothetical protein